MADKKLKALPRGPAKARLKITFVRHGQARAQEPRDGVRGPSLSALGRRQAACVARRLAAETFDRIYASDMRRAFETMAAIRKCHRRTPLTVSRDIREIMHHHFMRERLCSKPEVRRQFRAEARAVRRFAARLLRKHRRGGNLLVVAHGNLIRTLMPLLCCRKPLDTILMDTKNTAVFIMEAGIWESPLIRVANCIRHLPTRLIT
jgi:broad specificity phosphatase PhoE